MKRSLFLRPEAFVAAARMAAPAAGPAHDAATWRRTFPEATKEALAAARRLFPATSPATLARWISIRSGAASEGAAVPALFRAEPGRATLLPLRDPEMWAFRKAIERLHWTADEVDLAGDVADCKRVTAGERELVWAVLGFFGVADELILEGLDERMSDLIRQKEGRFYLRAQADQECVHSEAYSRQIEEVVPAERRAEIFAAVRTNPAVARMADWIRWWVYADHPPSDLFVAMAFSEGNMFSGMFVVPQAFKVRGLFSGIATFNELIARDENKHADAWCFCARKRCGREPDPAVVKAIAAEIVGLSRDFFAAAIPRPVAGLSAALLDQHVRSVADAIAGKLGCAPIFGAESPFAFMDQLALNEVGKSNFFEHRVTQYQTLGAGALRFAVADDDFDPDRL